MISRQLELGLKNRTMISFRSHSRGRSSRAHWWFEQMRGIVQDARDWPPATPVPRRSLNLPPVAPADRSPPDVSDQPPPGTNPDAGSPPAANVTDPKPAE
jgi:hypothetical protein